jgi:hypothetical protein
MKTRSRGKKTTYKRSRMRSKKRRRKRGERGTINLGGRRRSCKSRWNTILSGKLGPVHHLEMA